MRSSTLHSPPHAAVEPVVSPPTAFTGFTGAAGAAPRTVTSRSLLGNTNEVLIEHHGALYRLRQTSLGKLILTK